MPNQNNQKDPTANPAVISLRPDISKGCVRIRNPDPMAVGRCLVPMSVKLSRESQWNFAFSEIF